MSLKLYIGDLLRLVNPAVRDFIGGIALAAQIGQPRLAQPPHNQDDLGLDPGPDQPRFTPFNNDGLAVGPAGDLARLGAALGRRSVRAFMLGLAQLRSGDDNRFTEVSDMAASLLDATAESRLDRESFLDAWRDVFSRRTKRIVLEQSTQGEQSAVVSCFDISKPGTYLADAQIALSSGHVGGSLRIATTVRSGTIIRTDRYLAQLDSELSKVSARFNAADGRLYLILGGLKDIAIDWTAFVNLYPPVARKRRSHR